MFKIKHHWMASLRGFSFRLVNKSACRYLRLSGIKYVNMEMKMTLSLIFKRDFFRCELCANIDETVI